MLKLALLLAPLMAATSAHAQGFCSDLQEAIKDTEGMCTLKACKPDDVTVNCEFPLEYSGTVLDHFSANTTIDVCPPAGTAASIVFNFHETEEDFTVTKKVESDESTPIDLWSFDFLVAKVEADATIGISISGDSAHIQIGIDACATDVLGDKYCGKDMDPKDLPVIYSIVWGLACLSRPRSVLMPLCVAHCLFSFASGL
jgi:hypothetical protein